MTERTKKGLVKIIAYAKKILSYTNNYSFEAFENDTKTLEAVVFNLSQIGELANIIDDETKALYYNVDWQGMKGLRNRIVHDYEGIKPKLIWSIITDDLNSLITDLERLLLI